MEEMLISRVLPIMQVRYTKGGQLCYKEHVVNFPQDISTIASHLPRLPEQTDMIIIRKDDVDLSRHVDFMVRRNRVREALEYKIASDPNYADLQVNDEALSQLPVNGSVAHRVPTCRPGRQENAPVQAAGPEQAAGTEDANDENEQHVDGVLNLGLGGDSEVQRVRSRANEVVGAEEAPAPNPIVSDSIGDNGLNRHLHVYISTAACPAARKYTHW